MNKFMFIGNVTKDAEVQKVGNDLSICKFDVAVNRPYQKGKEQEVDYYKVITWRGQADYCGQNLKKGNKVFVCGRLEIRDYDGKDGVKHTVVEVQANEVEKLTGFEKKDGAVKSSYTMEQATEIQLRPVVDTGDLPF